MSARVSRAEIRRADDDDDDDDDEPDDERDDDDGPWWWRGGANAEMLAGRWESTASVVSSGNFIVSKQSRVTRS
jgi:hypothetical protein